MTSAKLSKEIDRRDRTQCEPPLDGADFDLYKLQPYVNGERSVIPYNKRRYCKIMLIQGQSKVYFADRIYEIRKHALFFASPHLPYIWEYLDKVRSGVYCVFTPRFFEQYGAFCQYEVFQPKGTHVFELTDEQFACVSDTYDQINSDFESDYKYKFDSIRNRIFDLLHFALKLKPGPSTQESHPQIAYNRITSLFSELLERQFPINNEHRSISFKSPNEYADSLNIHVNSLNRAVKAITAKTTSEVIAERLIKEAKLLLSQTHWSIAEISSALGFKEATHFNNFFKKHQNESPKQFRSMQS